jgi:molecular chaperone GrpE (heat shock protein)
MNWGEILDKYGVPGLVLAIIAYILVKERQKIFDFVFRRAERKQKAALEEAERKQKAALEEAKSETRFDEALREQLLQQSKQYQELIDRMFGLLEEQRNQYQEMLRTERLERSLATNSSIQSAAQTIGFITKALEVMQDFADIARSQAASLKRAIVPMVDVLQSLEIIVKVLLIVLSRLHLGDEEEQIQGLRDALKRRGR